MLLSSFVRRIIAAAATSIKISISQEKRVGNTAENRCGHWRSIAKRKTYIIGKLKDEISVPFGVNVVKNPIATIDLGAATGAKFGRSCFSGAITLEDIEPYKEEICEGKIVLFNTNWYKTRGTDEFFHHPYVNGDVAKYLVDNGVRFIGIDTINADQTGGTEFPVHDLFSEKRLMIGENWAFFDQIDFERPYVIALPMKLIGCDGSPVRAIAVQWEEE